MNFIIYCTKILIILDFIIFIGSNLLIVTKVHKFLTLCCVEKHEYGRMASIPAEYVLKIAQKTPEDGLKRIKCYSLQFILLDANNLI
jgi:hypothetical protein